MTTGGTGDSLLCVNSLNVSRLSKSRFMAGTQCHKLLWWKVHEPDAQELQPDKVLQDLFDQGRQVGELARTFFDGVLIDPSTSVEDRVLATQEALVSSAPCLFEASFMVDDVFVAVDILQRVDGGFHLYEVKSSSSQKPEHVVDAAFQKYLLEQSGVKLVAVSIMHLNKEFRHPSTGDLFTTTDVTHPVEQYLSTIPGEVQRQLAVLQGPLPEVNIGLQCVDPRDCPFMERCWPDSRDHISKLYRVGVKTAVGYMQQGIHYISDIPAGKKLPDPAKRQRKAMTQDRLIVEPTLSDALRPLECKLGFLDFETIARAIPVWHNMGPWHQAAAQFSYHEDNDDGTYSHAEFLAEGPEDARPILAEAMVAATANAERVVMYTTFERTRIRDLQKSVPHLATELKHLEEKLIDLHPIVRDHVYHPDFLGSFSLKYILTPLVPDLTYSDLVIIDGRVASVEIARLLFVTGRIPEAHREQTRRDLLEYCKRDTWSMVRLVEQLRELGQAV